MTSGWAGTGIRPQSREEGYDYHQTSGALQQHLRPRRRRAGPQIAKAETAGPKSGITAETAQRLVVEQFMIDAADPGVKLYVRNKHSEDLKQFSWEKTLLFVHGATQPSEATFDLPLEGAYFTKSGQRFR